jgi:hypothetical protein
MVYAQSSFLFYDSCQVGVCPSIYILVLRVAMVGIYIVGANMHLVLVETTNLKTGKRCIGKFAINKSRLNYTSRF